MASATTAAIAAFAVLWLAVAGLLAAMVATDLRERRIPNALVAALGIAWVLMQAVLGSFGAFAGVPLLEAARGCGVPEPLLHLFALPSALTGALTAVVAVALLAGAGALYERLFRKAPMGAGDVKLIGAFALFLGPVPTVVCVMLACVFALAAAVPARLRTFPFAPALALAFACLVFFEL